MRTQATIVPTFWTRGSGKKLRGDADAQVLALYFMTSPYSTSMGLYYEPLHSILSETGLTEDRFRKAIDKVNEIALYDEQEGLVFLPQGAAHQIGERLSPGDKKRTGILSQLKIYQGHRFAELWVERYYEPYNLSQSGIRFPSRVSNGSPSEAPLAPSMGHARPVHAPDPDPDPDPRSDPRSQEGSGVSPPMVASLADRAALWVKDPVKATMCYPNPHVWPEVLELRDLVATTHGVEPDALRAVQKNGDLDPRVAVVLARLAEGSDMARLRQAIRGSKHDELVSSKPQLQSLTTILKDPNAVDKYCRLARSAGVPTAASKTNAEVLTPEAAERRRRYREGQI